MTILRSLGGVLVGLLVLLATLAGLQTRANDQQQTRASDDAHVHPQAEHGAVEAMTAGHHHGGAHIKMTPLGAANPSDQKRADEIVEILRRSLEKYRDSRTAEADGYRPFLAHLPLPEYHFTNYRYGFLQAFSFDPARPTSLLYRKNGGRYELTGAMYTAPKHFSDDQLNKRVPLSVAQWHAHVNICMPEKSASKPDWQRFGFKGTIADAASCEKAGGRFYPQIFGWMVHAYPFEREQARIWAHAAR
jgi:hypothetical protein